MTEQQQQTSWPDQFEEPAGDHLMEPEQIPELGMPLDATPPAGEVARIDVPASQAQEFQVLGVVPRDFGEILQLAKHFAATELVPKDYQGKPENIVIAWQAGHEIGLKPMQALQSIAVVNGRAALWGDALPALAQTDPRYEWMRETWDPETQTATCIVKRYGEPAHIETFSMDDAKRAGLTEPRGKNGETSLYVKYPRRMCGIRCRTWALRNKFPGRFRGLPVAEEIIDLPPDQWKDVTPAMPQPRIPEPQSSSARPAAGASSGGVRLVTPQQIKMIYAKLSAKAIDKRLLLEQFHVPAVEQLPFAKMNDVLVWLDSFKA